MFVHIEHEEDKYDREKEGTVHEDTESRVYQGYASNLDSSKKEGLGFAVLVGCDCMLVSS